MLPMASCPVSASTALAGILGGHGRHSARRISLVAAPTCRAVDSWSTSGGASGSLFESSFAPPAERTRPIDAGALFGKVTSSVGDMGAVAPAQKGQYYQRALPDKQVPFASRDGRRLFREALAAGAMENYFFMAEQFRTQDEPTFCGLSTLAMVLNSLRIDPMRTWKGAWRWFNEQNLGCDETPSKVRQQGLSFDMFKRLASVNGARVTARRAPSAADEYFQVQKFSFAEEFRATVRATSRSSERECLVVCYSREALGQTGTGHFSPIGGYHEETDMVLIMDVASFKYPPHWASLEEVVDGMLQVDEQTGLPRGYLQLRAPLEATDEWLHLKPLHIPSIPEAAGKHLAEALSAAFAPETGEAEAPRMPSTGREGAAKAAVERWLRAASVAEPQVLSKLLQAGDEASLIDVLQRLQRMPLFADLCTAYEQLRRTEGNGCADGGMCMTREFPPLLFSGGDCVEEFALSDNSGLNLDSCGELWVLLLLLLPDHLRARASHMLSGNCVGREVSQAVRGPWALPLETIRESLSRTLPEPAHAGGHGWWQEGTTE